MRLRVLVLAAGLLWPVSVFSETTPEFDVFSFADGNELFRVCSDHDHGSAQGYCQGYVAGAMDAFVAAIGLKARGYAIPSFCPPEKHVAPDQVRDIVVRWLTTHPETRHNAASHEALVALLAAFPCKEQAH